VDVCAKAKGCIYSIYKNTAFCHNKMLTNGVEGALPAAVSVVSCCLNSKLRWIFQVIVHET